MRRAILIGWVSLALACQSEPVAPVPEQDPPHHTTTVTPAPAPEETPADDPQEEAPKAPALVAPPEAQDVNAAANVTEVNLTAAAAELEILKGKKTKTLAFNGTTPGPTIRAKKGDKVIVHFTNNLDTETTIHWHGVRVPNTMDGMQQVQSPIAPGASFTYEFTVPDSGTYWYHPHVRSDEQVDRGLYGMFIVEDPAEPKVDLELPVVLDDWSLSKTTGQITAFGGHMDAMHGRQGNVATLNGVQTPQLEVTKGQVVRFRFVNAANARYFGVRIKEHAAQLIARDNGRLVDAEEVDEVTVVPGSRAELVVPMKGNPGDTYNIEYFYPDLPTEKPVVVGTVRYKTDAGTKPTLPTFPPTTLPVFVNRAADQTWTLDMGAAGQPMWIIEGAGAYTDHIMFKKDSYNVILIDNPSEMDHPIHIHGLRFQVLEGPGSEERSWFDTINVPAGNKVKLGVMADNPGMWMVHCHILDHAEAGMMRMLMVQ